MTDRWLGIDIGAETIKVVELRREGADLAWARRLVAEHHKEPGPVLLDLLAGLDWPSLRGAAVTGRFGRAIALPRIPLKEAQAGGHRYLHGSAPATVVSIGAHGFSVLELRGPGVEVFRENSRCSQGTGNFLRQLVERFGLTIEEASALCAEVPDPAPLSGRCPVILKTDMTHLANKGERRERILAGLFDAVCENVQVLVKPRVSPSPIVLVGGVSRSERIRARFRDFAERHEMRFAPVTDDNLYFEALGAAVAAADGRRRLPPLEGLLEPPGKAHFETIPALGTYLRQVRRMAPAPPAPASGAGLVLGLDIGSTGSKAVALDVGNRRVTWEGYRNTSGDPVGAAQALMRQFLAGPAGRSPVRALGATGSGREIVGSLMATCYGPDAVFVLNEIAAHATGALHHDPRVDTIFEIGGQDAKYIRLVEGRVVDAAMNEACSAGTGSFIEEQGKRFSGIDSVAQLGEAAIRSDCAVSLGQHCSVFMAEIIDAAAAAGVDRAAIIPGIYDSVIQNYLNRVKGSRSVGQVVFCQGMPFAAPALAAAVARQTGCEVIIPPNPGTVGALGIALLTLEQRAAGALPALDPARFLEARVEAKDTFVCRSTRGCGGAGNRCRIDRLATVVAGQRKGFTWGGACSLHDRGTRRAKLPDRAPDPFRGREELVADLTARMTVPRGAPRIALTDEFLLKELYPFFVTFLHELGLDPVVRTAAGQATLRRGIEESNVPFCAPMQLYHGLVSELAAEATDYLFLPMLRQLPRAADEEHSVSCPIEQGSADLLRWDLGPERRPAIVSPTIDLGPGNLRSAALRAVCANLAKRVHAARRWRPAYEAAVREQERFDAACRGLGREALDFCAREAVIPGVVLGRSYTIHNGVLNSSVPAILREQGVLPIPVDCYPVGGEVPAFGDVYWGHAQRTLRAAHQVRRAKGVYSLFCTNYSCGPDSFTSHFYAYIMAGKPFAVIETDGHTGDAGTKTRVEAFLYCVRQDLGGAPETPPASLQAVADRRIAPDEFVGRDDTVLLPWLSEASDAIAACLRGRGMKVESLGVPDRESLRLGRRHTSGKECIPLALTLGRFLQRIERDDPARRFVLLMPSGSGPCRFGAYHLLQKVICDRAGLDGRVRFWSPADESYYAQVGEGFGALAFTAIVASDLLTAAMLEVASTEREPGLARAIRERFARDLHARLEEAGRGELSVGRAILEAASGRIFGCAELLEGAAAEFAAARGPGDAPTVLLVGEIYVRCDPFATDRIVERLQQRGVRVRVAPVAEWLEYAADCASARGASFGDRLSHRVQRRIQAVTHRIMARRLGWPARPTVQDVLAAAAPWIRRELAGEAILTLGAAVHEWRHGRIDGVLSVGPHECMPNKLAEAQFFHVAEQEGLLSLTLSLNGDPVDPAIVDRFVYEVQARYRRRTGAGQAEAPRQAPGEAPVPGASREATDARGMGVDWGVQPRRRGLAP